MALNFPIANLYPGYEYTGDNGVVYTYDGTKWIGSIAATTSIVNGDNIIQVDSNGNLVIPVGGQIIDQSGTTISGGPTDRLVNGSYEFTLGVDGTVNFSPSGANGKGVLQTTADLQFIAVDKTWTFGTNGTLTLPAGGDIDTSGNIFGGTGTFRNGDDSNGTNAYNQLIFGYGGTTDWAHYVRTRHNDSDYVGNAFDFFTNTSQQGGPDAPKHGLTINNGWVGINGNENPLYALDVNGNAGAAANRFFVKDNGRITFVENGSYITEQRPGQGYRYDAAPTVAVTGGGSGLTLNVQFGVGETSYTTVLLNDVGTGYYIGDQVKIPGDQLGGTTPANDLIVEVTSMSLGQPEPFGAGSINVISGTPVGYEDGLHFRVNGLEWTLGNDGNLILNAGIKFGDGTVQTTAATGGGNANTGNIRFNSDYIYNDSIGNPIYIESNWVNNGETLGELATRIVSKNGDGLKLSAYAPPTITSFNSDSWSVAEWQNDGGTGLIYLENARQIINFVDNVWSQGYSKYVRINGGNWIYVGSGYSTGGNNITISLDFDDVPENSPETIDYLDFKWQRESRIVLEDDALNTRIVGAIETRSQNANDYSVAYQSSTQWEAYAENDNDGEYGAWAWIRADLSDGINSPKVFIENVPADTGMAKRWTFDKDGHLITPGNIDAGGNLTVDLNHFIGLASEDPNWAMGYRHGGYSKETVYGTIDIRVGQGSWPNGQDGFTVGQCDGGESIMELNGYTKNAWFRHHVIARSGRFVQDCSDGFTSFRWVNSNSDGEDIELGRVYSDGSDGVYFAGDEPESNERVQFGFKNDAGVSSFYIISTENPNGLGDENADKRWNFLGTGGLQFPDGTIQTTASAGNITISDTTPSTNNGTLWFNTVEARVYVKYNNQWVDASPTVLPEPDNNPTFESVTFNDATVQTTAWTGTYSYNDLTDKPAFVGGGGASTWLTAE